MWTDVLRSNLNHEYENIITATTIWSDCRVLSHNYYYYALNELLLYSAVLPSRRQLRYLYIVDLHGKASERKVWSGFEWGLYSDSGLYYGFLLSCQQLQPLWLHLRLPVLIPAPLTDDSVLLEYHNLVVLQGFFFLSCIRFQFVDVVWKKKDEIQERFWEKQGTMGGKSKHWAGLSSFIWSL